MTFGSESLCRIFYKQSQCKGPFSILLTSDDGTTVADDIWQEILVSHPYNQSECLLLLPIFLTSADGRVVADDVQQPIMVSHA